MTIARELLQAEDADHAAAVLQKADLQLDVWESSRRPTKIEDRKVVLPFGVELRLPQEFEPRDEHRCGARANRRRYARHIPVDHTKKPNRLSRKVSACSLT
jgi:hypothetical protein